MIYSLLRPLLFCLQPETAHHVVLKALHAVPARLFSKPTSNPVQALGLEFPHAIGLAAGFDKNGEYLDDLSKLGFSFIEVGTVTPRPQGGNPKPRLFRLPKAHALINRMGFNNHGVDALVARFQKKKYQGILGVNIGKNKDTSLDRAVEDYLYCLRQVYVHTSYVVVNLSSPNTPSLRALQHGDYFSNLMNALREEQLYLADKHQRYVPLVVKVSPDEPDETLKTMADVMLSLGIEGIIATNTTSSRAGVEGLPHGGEEGGLSGPPLAARATACLRLLKEQVGDEISLIATGGIDTLSVARDKLAAGASLLQLYTGFIYQGPGLVLALAKGLAEPVEDASSAALI